MPVMVGQLPRPKGTLQFRYRSRGLCNPELGNLLILEETAGNTLWRVERDVGLRLRFVHASPGTGTREAEVDLHELEPTESLHVTMVWSSQDITLSVGRLDGPRKLIVARGIPTKGRQFRVGEDGGVYEVGDNGVRVAGISVYKGGRQVLEETARNSWAHVCEAVPILLVKATEIDDHLFKVVVANQVLVMLVTGFENYARKRFLEMEMEGRPVDFDRLARCFHSQREVQKGLIEDLVERANTESRTPTSLLVEDRRNSRVDFGNFQDCKQAYRKGYDISFGRDIGVSSQVLDFVQRIIQYRHRIVHSSPTIGMLNQDSVPPEKPAFSSPQLAQEALGKFDEFIQGLHQATLRD